MITFAPLPGSDILKPVIIEEIDSALANSVTFGVRL